MKKINSAAFFSFSLIVFVGGLSLAACGIRQEILQRDEVIGGVSVPIPRGMSKTSDGRIEVTLPGFGGEKIAYRGNVEPDDVITFYKKEMPERGWRPNATLATRGGMLAYTKDDRSVLIVVSSADRSATTLSIVVGSLGSRP